MGVVQSSGVSEWGNLSVPSVVAAAHELKSPLVLMRQLAYQLEMAGELSPEQRIVQQRIKLTSDRALRLVENITQTGRLEQAMFALEPLQVAAVWSDVAGEIQPLAQHMNQDIKLAIPKKPMLVVGHRDLLPAVLMGLCDNALSHNPNGSHIKLSARQTSESVVFSVRDNGPVIDAKVFRELDARLGHAPQPLGARPNSSGLGLWIAGTFARAMSSTISVTRHRAGGMTFSLHVPVSGQLSLL